MPNRRSPRPRLVDVDASPELLGQLTQLSLVTGMLGAAVYYFHRRDVRSTEKNETREREIQKKCDDDRAEMAGRIRQLEDRQHQMHESTLAQVGRALEFNTRALERFCDDYGSGFHKIIGNKS